jgi:hypothetical protein
MKKPEKNYYSEDASYALKNANRFRRMAYYSFAMMGVFVCVSIDGVIEMNISSTGVPYGLPDLGNIGNGLSIFVMGSIFTCVSNNLGNRMLSYADVSRTMVENSDDIAIENELDDINQWRDDYDED